ncbi:MAG: hypothetical protein PHU14_13585 [Methylovulum sp.]|nr:hypothetical protein [Methylovulum sp.]
MQFFEVETEAGNKLIINKNYVVELEPIENDFKKGAVIHLAKEAAKNASITVSGKESVKVRSWLLS